MKEGLILDDNFKDINTPDAACEHYSKPYLKGEIDLTTLRSILREKHNFTEEDVRITARVLSNLHMQQAQSPLKTLLYAGIVFGLIIGVMGVSFWLYLLSKGIFAFLPFSIGLIGVGGTFASFNAFKSKR